MTYRVACSIRCTRTEAYMRTLTNGSHTHTRTGNHSFACAQTHSGVYQIHIPCEDVTMHACWHGAFHRSCINKPFSDKVWCQVALLANARKLHTNRITQMTMRLEAGSHQQTFKGKRKTMENMTTRIQRIRLSCRVHGECVGSATRRRHKR